MSNNTNAFHLGVRFTEIGIAGIWLLMLYPILLWTVVGTLSAYGFQDKVTHIQDQDGESLSIPTIIRRAEQFYKIQDQKQQFESQLKQLNQETIEINKKIIFNEERNYLWEQKWDDFKIKIVPKLDALNDQQNIANPEYFDIAEIGNGIENYKSEPDITPHINTYQQFAFEHEKIEKEHMRFHTDLQKIKTESQLIKKEINKHEAESLKVIEKNNGGDFIIELDYMRKLNFNHFATMPSQLLTLILTITMGTLGSLIYLTMDFFNDKENKSFSWYLFRPFLGMVTAVAIFILAKAGQLTISDTSATQSLSENLNPFFISFLGIISGLLSEQATEKIRTAGISFFRSREDKFDQKRWAIGLSKAIQEQGKNTKELSQYLNTPEDVINSWVEEKKPVPSAAQLIISAWLSLPVRDLFSDLEPGA